MILVQKPFTLSSPTQSPLYIHRRHPSAPPTVVVQPTRTPGLLTLSKPPFHRQNQRQTPKPLPKSNSTPVVRAPLLNSPAEITLTKKSGVIALPATPSPQPRGRGQVNHPKDKVQNQRSPSYPSVRGKHGRQLSPTPQSQLQQIPSQAEVAVISSINSTNLFDPFIDNDSSLSSNPPSPTLSFHPSRNLANRMQQRHTPPPSTLHSEAIPVPAATRRQTSNISRSVPLPSHIPQRPRPIPTRPSTFQHFPICDDMNDAADNGVPTTPLATRFHYDNGLQTAPISTRASGAFPLNSMRIDSSSSLVANKRRNRKHRRAPSEGVFHMSSDEDISSGPDGTVLNPNVKALFGLANTFDHSLNMTPSTPIRTIPPYKRDSGSPSSGSFKERQSEREAAEKAAGYFASSMFQNSPSPEELPDPLLL